MHAQRISMKTNFSPDCIIAMGETAVWSDMVGNMTVDTTMKKGAPLKSTAKAEGTGQNQNLLLLFKVLSAKQFKSMCCGIILKRLDELRACFEIFETGLRNAFFKKRLFAWDTFKAHMTEC